MVDQTGTRIDISKASFVASTAAIFGHVVLEAGSSVWFNTVIRSEARHVRIGKFSNVQDLVMIHIGGRHPTIVGDYCSITHRAVLHGCTIGDFCLVGIGAIVMDGAVVGDGSIIGGNSFVPPGMQIPPMSVVVGSPAKIIRQTDSTIPNIFNALLYNKNAEAYARGEHRSWESLQMDNLRVQAAELAEQLRAKPEAE